MQKMRKTFHALQPVNWSVPATSEPLSRTAFSDTVSWREPIDDYLMQISGTLEEKTVSFYANRLHMLLQWAQSDKQQIALRDFKARHLRIYLAERAEAGVSESTRRHDAVSARAFFKFCKREEYLPCDPLADYKVARPQRAYVKCPSDEEVARLLRSLVDRWKPSLNPPIRNVHLSARIFFQRRNFAIVAGLIETACRVGELISLTLDDYQPKEMQIVIREAKGNEPRIVPISQYWIDAVDTYMKVRPKVESSLLFVNEYGLPVTVDVFGQQFRGYLKYAGLSGFSLHGLRHYALTKLAETDVWAASQIAGHKDLKITRQYLHSNMQHLRQVHAQAAPLGRLLVNTRSAAQRKKVI